MSAALTDLATIIGARDSSPAGQGLSTLLGRIADNHSAGPSGNCETCSFGNAEWPCGDWLESLDIAVAWVAQYLAVERADE